MFLFASLSGKSLATEGKGKVYPSRRGRSLERQRGKRAKLLTPRAAGAWPLLLRPSSRIFLRVPTSLCCDKSSSCLELLNGVLKKKKRDEDGSELGRHVEALVEIVESLQKSAISTAGNTEARKKPERFVAKTFCFAISSYIYGKS